MENPYYVGPQTYLQGAQALGQAFSQGLQDFQGSGGQQMAGMANSAAQGAAVGTSIAPGIGTAIGAGVGALASGIGNAIGTNQFIQDSSANFQGFNDEYGVPTYDFQGQEQAQATANQLGEIADKPALGNLALRRGKARDKQRQIEANIQNQQNQFNTANTQYQQGLLQRQAYQDQLNNVYNIPMGYF
jgi:hypothetical protein